MHLASVQGHWAKDCPNQTAGAGDGGSSYGGGYGGTSYSGRKDYGGRGGGGYGGGSYGGGSSQGESVMMTIPAASAVCRAMSCVAECRLGHQVLCMCINLYEGRNE